MKALLIALSIFAASIAQAGLFDKVPTKSGNYCKDEVEEYLARHFGKNSYKKIINASQSKVINFWVEMDSRVCKGNLVFDGFHQVESRECSIAQYGSRTYFINRVWGTSESCARAARNHRL